MIWVALAWGAHGHGTRIHGVYSTREAAFEDLRNLPNMTVWVDLAGHVRGRPRRERSGDAHWRGWLPEQWAEARPWKIQDRKDRR